MGGWAAKKLCPHVIVVPRRASRRTRRRARTSSRSSRTRRRWSRGCRSTRRSSTCAGWSGSRGRPREIAARLRVRVREEVGLPITVGVARTKFLAKVASAQAKPDGLLVVPPDGELEFLHPLPVEALWGVGKVTAGKLHARGITDRRAGGRACRRRRWSGSSARRSGRHLHALAHNRDPRRVTHGRAPALDRRPARDGPARPEDARGAGRDAGRADRPDRPPAARGAAGVPHGDPAAALRRLHRARPARRRWPRQRATRARCSPARASCSRARCR